MERQSRSWAEMAPDALVHIFRRLTLCELLTIIPCVCKPWKLASLNALCYQSLDLYPFRKNAFCKYDSHGGFSLRSFTGYRLTELLLARSQGCLLEISHPIFIYLVAGSAPLLQKLHIPESFPDKEWAIYAAPLMPHIVDLDISVCDNKLSHEVIEAFGKSCKHMRVLRRNRPPFRKRSMRLLPRNWPPFWAQGWAEDGPGRDDSEAVAIAQYYPCLEHLELRCNPLSKKGLNAILDNCPLLEYLDLSGCVYLQEDMDSSLFHKCHAQVKFFKNIFSDEQDSGEVLQE